MSSTNQPVQPLLLIIFGITGDLARRKLLPALLSLYDRGALPEDFYIIGVSRQKLDISKIMEGVTTHITVSPAMIQEFAAHIQMRCLDLKNQSDYIALRHHVQSLMTDLGGNVIRLYYLSIPADAFEGIVDLLGKTGHNIPFENETRPPSLLVEKPFGSNSASAQALINVADAHFAESQIFRIDHYLAKETAQNILTFRFCNPLFESIWNNRHIDAITVCSFESIGIENRVHFYESTGALRDSIQSHLLQLLALITMERPVTMTSIDIHRVKLQLLQSIVPITYNQVPTATKRGQYQTYRQEVQNQHTTTETYAALQLQIDNEQWRNTVINLRAGKAMAETYTEISVHFRPTHNAHGDNTLVFRLQPKEGIALGLQAKVPGMEHTTQTVAMDFGYAQTFDVIIPDAYERVIIDALRGDQSLFASAEEVKTSWHIIENVLQYWQSTNDNLTIYPNGTKPNNL